MLAIGTMFYSQDMETIQMSINTWMDKENVVYRYRYYSLKTEEISSICDNMDETRRHYAKWNKSVTEGWILYDCR